MVEEQNQFERKERGAEDCCRTTLVSFLSDISNLNVQAPEPIRFAVSGILPLSNFKQSGEKVVLVIPGFHLFPALYVIHGHILPAKNSGALYL